MIFAKLFSDQFVFIKENPTKTRSNKVILPIHSEIARIISSYTKYKVISLPQSEYCYNSLIGTKKVDIAVVDENDNLKAAIMFKGVRSEYNKNANNFYENMKGESSLFLDGNIPVYQIIFIPTKVRHKNSNGEMTFETPSERSFNNYCNFYKNHTPYWNKLKLGVFYFDINYDNFETEYSDKKIPGMEKTLTEGLINFIKEVNNG